MIKLYLKENKSRNFLGSIDIFFLPLEAKNGLIRVWQKKIKLK